MLPLYKKNTTISIKIVVFASFIYFTYSFKFLFLYCNSPIFSVVTYPAGAFITSGMMTIHGYAGTAVFNPYRSFILRCKDAK